MINQLIKMASKWLATYGKVQQSREVDGTRGTVIQFSYLRLAESSQQIDLPTLP